MQSIEAKKRGTGIFQGYQSKKSIICKLNRQTEIIPYNEKNVKICSLFS